MTSLRKECWRQHCKRPMVVELPKCSGRERTNGESMNTKVKLVAAAIWLLTAQIVNAQSVSVPSPSSAVQSSLSSVQADLLGNKQRAAAWTKALQLESIEKQLRLGDDADVEQIGKLARAVYSAERPIDPKYLTAVRDALQDWLTASAAAPTMAKEESQAPDKPEDQDQGEEKAEGQAQDSDQRENDAADSDKDGETEAGGSTAEADKQEFMSKEGSEQVVTAVNELESWLKRNGAHYANWTNPLRLREIKKLAGSPESAERDEVLIRTEQFQAECTGSDRAPYVGLRRDLQAWQDALKYPVDEPLAVEARRAEADFPGIETHRVMQLRSELIDHVTCLDRFLATSPEQGERWKEFLLFDKLETELNDTILPQVRPLISVFERFSSGEPGLRMRQFADVRDSLDSLIQVLSIHELQPKRITETRLQLVQSVAQLDSYLQRGSDKRQKLWKEFLKWDTLQEQLGEQVPDLAKLNRVMKQLESGEDGLDLPRFRTVSHRLGKYMEVVRVTRNNYARDVYVGHMDRLARNVELHTLDPTNDTTSQLINHLKWLKAIGLNTGLANRIRTENTRPNLFAAISGTFVAKTISDRINDQKPINRCFEGSRVCGTATTQADVTGVLQPCENGVIVDVLIGGTTITNTVANQRRVYISAQGTTAFHGGARLYLNLDGISASQATASATTRQNICDICVDRRIGRRLIGRVASRRAEETRPRAELSQTEEAEQALANQLNEQLTAMVDRANDRIQQMMARVDIDEQLMPEVKLRSTARKILANGKLTLGDFLGASSTAPNVGAESDVTMQVHQSAINNVLSQMLGGIKLNNERMVQLLEENNFAVPPQLAAGASSATGDDSADGSDSHGATDNSTNDSDDDDEDQDWSITFDVLQPATVTFTDGKIQIAIFGRRFSQGDRVINEPIRISANYRLRANSRQQIEGRRIGDLDVTFVKSPNKSTTRQLAYKAFIAKKMRILFRRRLSLDDLPKNEMTDQLASLKLDHVEATRGWLALAVALDNVDLGMDKSATSTPIPVAIVPPAPIASASFSQRPTTTNSPRRRGRRRALR